MENDSIVRATHLSRIAFVYPRQSDQKQVVKNTGSRDYQLAQVDVARRLGWKDEMIRLVDQDLGCSGTTTIGRTSYQYMVGELRAGRAGAIVVSALDRAGRDDIELQVLLKDCALFDTLMVLDGKPIDLTSSDELVVQQIMAIFAGKENAKRRDRMRQGLFGKLAKGLAMSRPPAGYVVTSKGKWGFDPDPVAQVSIQTAFRTLLRLRSFPKASRALREQGVLLPRRVREPRSSQGDDHGEVPGIDGDDRVVVLRWHRPTVHALLFLAKNRNYTGDYVYGRPRVDPRLGRSSSGKVRMRWAADDELVVIPNHHPAYIDHQQFVELQHIIEVNRPSQERRNMGCGPALLEGALVRCETHGRRAMRVSYQVDRKGVSRWWYYICSGERLAGGAGCACVAAAVLEPIVVGALLERLNTPRLEDLRHAWQEARIAEGDEDCRREAELTRAREEVKKAKRRCLAVDQEKHPQVAEEYEALWEEAKTSLKQVESLAALPRTTLSLFTDESWDEFLALSGERQALWDAPTTIVQDKKELVRTLVKAVIMESVRGDEVRRGRIVWQDGAEDTPFALPTRTSVRNQIHQLASDGHRPREIAARLNQLGVPNLQGRPWSAETVAKRAVHQGASPPKDSDATVPYDEEPERVVCAMHKAASPE